MIIWSSGKFEYEDGYEDMQPVEKIRLVQFEFMHICTCL